MKRAMGAASLLLGALLLSGCGEYDTCYGTEPDGEVEKLRPCPPGWKVGDHRYIKEDEFKNLEVAGFKEHPRKRGL